MLTKPILGQGLHLRVSKRPRAEPAPVTRLPSRSARLGDGGHPQVGRASLQSAQRRLPSGQGPPRHFPSAEMLVPCGGGRGWRGRGLEALETGTSLATCLEATDVMSSCVDGARRVSLRANALGSAVRLRPPHGKGDVPSIPTQTHTSFGRESPDCNSICWGQARDRKVKDRTLEPGP